MRLETILNSLKAAETLQVSLNKMNEPFDDGGKLFNLSKNRLGELDRWLRSMSLSSAAVVVAGPRNQIKGAN